MIKNLLSLLIIVGCLSAKAQDALHLTVDATYFDPATLEFYKLQDNGNSTVFYIDMHFNDDTNIFTVRPFEAQAVNFESHLSTRQKSVNDLVLMSAIKKGKTGYNKAVEGFAYRSLPKTTQTSNFFSTLNIINPDYFMAVKHYGEKDDTGNYTYRHDVDYIRFATIVVNKSFTIYLDEDSDYHIVNYNGMFSLYMNERYQKMSAYTPSKQVTALFRNTYPIGEKFEKNGKTGLKGYHSNKVVVPAVYDSLFTDWRYFILAYQNNKPHLFYHNGEPVKLKNLRAVYKGYNPSVLTGNTVSWISPDGTLTNKAEPEIICGAYNIRPDSILVSNGHFILRQYEYEPQNSSYYLSGEWTLAPTTAFKQLYFINGHTAANDMEHHNLIAETHDGKKGIITPGSNGDYTILLTPEYQTFTYLYTHYIRIDTKNGLSGYFPLNKEARYTQLSEFDKGFARFTLPNGKQGWLALDGIEYLDE